jgi:phosphoglycolate phosphatase-like HAD superfamily hydrolase
MAAGDIANASPVPGAVDGVKKLKELGLRLAIVTARSPDQSDVTDSWIAQHLPRE